MDNISLIEERQIKLDSLQDRINRTIQQIQFDGLISIFDVERLRCIGKIWISLLNHFKLERSEDSKRVIISDLIKLYDYGQISADLCTEIIISV